MVQTQEAQAFLARVAALPKGPGVNLDQVLQPSLDDEMELRRLFATDRSNSRLSNPYVGLVDVFDAPSDIRTTRARVVKDDQDLNAKHVMPLSEEKRRKEGEPCVVADLDEFKKNWNIFTEGSLSQLADWSNVVAAGGSVLACLTPLSDADKASKRAMRKHYHSAAYPTSDVDLFLWGLTPEQAEKKIVVIYEAVRDSVPWDVTCVRTKNTISIHSQYPYRSVQIVLRLYRSPAEILAGFDIDAPCCAYDGTRVWVNPRAVVSMMRQSNTTDVTRRSPSYEVRLSKYARRGFEVYVPSLIRSDVDPTIFERSIARVEGFARLLVLERLGSVDQRQEFLKNRRVLRGRPAAPDRNRNYRKLKRKYKGDLKLGEIDQLEMNDYDVGSLHIPYGPGWDARRIDKLIYQTDLGMNSTFNPKNKGRRLHRHPAFFGTIQECMEDCCEHCPEPVDEAERELQVKEDESYIRGRIIFMQENPGRQIITGSFNPIDVGEWSAQVYIGTTERFFIAIAAHNREVVAGLINGGVDVNRRDHVGRSPLHFAIICNATEIACDLVDAGARITARLVDGKTSLHLAIQQDQLSVVRKLLIKSAANKANAGNKALPENMEKEEAEGTDRARLSSEDDWSSEDDGVMEVHENDNEQSGGGGDVSGNQKKEEERKDNQETEGANGEIPDDNNEEPDVFDLTVADWDHGLTPLAYAVIFASLPIVEDLIAAGVDVKASTKSDVRDVHPLLLTAVRPDEDEACKIAEMLILAGATSSPADKEFTTTFLRVVAAEKAKLVSTILKYDPNAGSVVNFPSIRWVVILPIILAIQSRSYAMVATLLAHGAKLSIQEEDIVKVLDTRPLTETTQFRTRISDLVDTTFLPVETAIARYDDMIQLLVALGVEVNVCIQDTKHSYISDDRKKTILDWVAFAIQNLDTKIESEKNNFEIEPVDLSKATSWKEYTGLAVKLRRQHWKNNQKSFELKIKRLEGIRAYLQDTRDLLLSVGAKSYAEIRNLQRPGDVNVSQTAPEEHPTDNCGFVLMSSSYSVFEVPKHEVPKYHELFQACFNGDNAAIQALCLPSEETEHSAPPLLVAVQLADPQKSGSIYGAKTGITAFSVTVERRSWDTARLILAIASSQYEKEEPINVFSADDIELDDNASDRGSDHHSDDSDMTVDQVEKENYYVDISKRLSVVKCNVNPGVFFTTVRPYTCLDERGKIENAPLAEAIRTGDVEGFVKLVNMIDAFHLPIGNADPLLQSIIYQDEPEMLDEFIRHMAVGIDLEVVRHETKNAIPANDSNRVYLGLNVHGKKRTDLATKHDPNAQRKGERQHPLLWRALDAGSVKIVDYLTSEKPFLAYRAYAMSHSDEQAERLRNVVNLKVLLPQWLGLKVDSLGESSLAAAVLSGKMEMVKILLAKDKQLMKTMLHGKWKIEDSNILHIAVRGRKEVDTELLDFILLKNVSPLERDRHGFNIYHYLCVTNNCRLLKHLLGKLPPDASEALLKQQTTKLLQTPLHIAASTGALGAVELILAKSNGATIVRDSDGCIPLHVATQRCFRNIVKLLVDASPSTLLVENGVGNTPLETVSNIRFQEMLTITSRSFGVGRLADSHVDENVEHFDHVRLEKEVSLLRQMIDTLSKDGRFIRDVKLESELSAFAGVIESRVQRLRQASETAQEEGEQVNKHDRQDTEGTYATIWEALKDVRGERVLVRLIDVQKSVDRNLTAAASTKDGNPGEDDGHDFGKEVIHEDKSFVQERIWG